jgi:hypothetical protein
MPVIPSSRDAEIRRKTEALGQTRQQKFIRPD